MLGLIIVCWAYLIFILLEMIAIHDKCDKYHNVVRTINNKTIIALVILLAVLYKL